MAKIPIIAVSQANRPQGQSGGQGDAVMDTSRVAQSDRIAQDSTVVIALEQKDGIMTVQMVKVRDSVAGKSLRYQCDIDRGIWTFIPETGAASEEECESLRSQFDYTDEEAPF